MNPGNDEIAGTLVANANGGQRTTDIAGAYVVRERESNGPTARQGERRA